MSNLIAFDSASAFSRSTEKNWISPISLLSGREVEVLDLSAEGLGNKDIAAKIGVGYDTVRAFKRTASMKLGVRGRNAAAEAWRAIKEGRRAA